MSIKAYFLDTYEKNGNKNSKSSIEMIEMENTMHDGLCKNIPKEYIFFITKLSSTLKMGTLSQYTYLASQL